MAPNEEYKKNPDNCVVFCDYTKNHVFFVYNSDK